jgi:hypothetical protein
MMPMPNTTLATRAAPENPTSLGGKLLNIFVSPGEVFDEVIAAPPGMANWRVPTLLVCLAGILLLQLAMPVEQAAAIRQLAGAAALSPEQEQMLSGIWPLVSSLGVSLAAFLGTFWSAFVLWLVGRVFLKVSFPYLKALEIVGLTGMILVLGTAVTGLLIAASGDAAARPSFSLLVGKLSPGRAHQVLDTLNFFHLWATTVLAIGLSRLSGVTFKEAAFWVFGYWLFARIALIILA